VVAGAAEVLAAYATEDVFYEHTSDFLFSDNASRAKAVIDAARHFPTPRTFAVLGRCLRAGPHVLRVAALDAAEQIGTDAVIPLIVEGLTHDTSACARRRWTSWRSWATPAAPIPRARCSGSSAAAT